MEHVFQLINTFIPPEFSRIIFYVLLGFIAYKVNLIYRMVKEEFDNSGRERVKILSDISIILKDLRKKRDNA